MPEAVQDGYEPTTPASSGNLLPAVYRADDTETIGAVGPLRELVTRIGAQAAVVRRSIDRLWEDQSIETCDGWVIPYIAELLGTKPRPGLDARGQRLDVAKTIYYRRRKGTLALLEQLAHDITGWEPGRRVLPPAGPDAPRAGPGARPARRRARPRRRPHPAAGRAAHRPAHRNPRRWLGGPAQPARRRAHRRRLRRVPPSRGRPPRPRRPRLVRHQQGRLLLWRTVAPPWTGPPRCRSPAARGTLRSTRPGGDPAVHPGRARRQRLRRELGSCRRVPPDAADHAAAGGACHVPRCPSGTSRLPRPNASLWPAALFGSAGHGHRRPAGPEPGAGVAGSRPVPARAGRPGGRRGQLRLRVVRQDRRRSLRPAQATPVAPRAWG